MATKVEITELPVSIRVALIIEKGGIMPVWFEETDKPDCDRVFIKEISSVWTYMEGTAKIVNFAVWDGSNSYKLSLNTKDFTWQYGISEITPYPTYSR